MIREGRAHIWTNTITVKQYRKQKGIKKYLKAMQPGIAVVPSDANPGNEPHNRGVYKPCGVVAQEVEIDAYVYDSISEQWNTLD